MDLFSPAALDLSTCFFSAMLLKLAPVGETRIRTSGGYRTVTKGVVMNVSVSASKTNIENTLWLKIPAERPTFKTINYIIIEYVICWPFVRFSSSTVLAIALLRKSDGAMTSENSSQILIECEFLRLFAHQIHCLYTRTDGDETTQCIITHLD